MVYIIADKFDIPALKSLVVKKVTQCIANSSNSPFFSSSLKLLYDSTTQSDRALKSIFIKEILSQQYSSLQNDDFVTLLSENGDIGLDLFRETLTGFRFNPKGPSSELVCKRSRCNAELVICGNCDREQFYYVDEVVDGKQIDFVCSAVTCQTMYSKVDLSFCADCKEKQKRTRRVDEAGL